MANQFFGCNVTELSTIAHESGADFDACFIPYSDMPAVTSSKSPDDAMALAYSYADPFQMESLGLLP